MAAPMGALHPGASGQDVPGRRAGGRDRLCVKEDGEQEVFAPSPA